MKDSIPELTALTDKTMFSFSVLVVLIGGIAYTTTMFAKVESATAKLEQFQKQQEDFNQIVRSIDQRLSRIEGNLDAKSKK